MPTNLDFVLGAPTVPPIPPQTVQRVDWQITIPVDVCAGHPFALRVAADSTRLVDELDENNNDRTITITPQWPAAPGYYVGVRRESVASYSASAFRVCTKAQNLTPTPTTWYYLLWTGSGTTPGIQLPVGLLPLNYDPVTQIGLALEGGVLRRSRGPQGTSAPGELMEVSGGAWLTPLIGLRTHWAAIYVDVAGPTLIGVSRNAARMYVL